VAIRPVFYNNKGVPIPPEIHGQKYLCLTTFRKSGVAVPTPVWFGEDDNKLYVMTRNDSGKYKRLRNNPNVRIAPCTIRGKVTGPEFPATARILPPEDWPRARQAINAKYWLARIPFLWSKQNVYVEIVPG
jgi:PPOX class probable F420-dependent enzyme